MRRALGALMALGLMGQTAQAAIGTDIVRTCQSDWFLSREVCTCVAEMAVERFSEVQLLWLALPAGDPATAAVLAHEMSYSEAQAVTNFIRSAPHQCEE